MNDKLKKKYPEYREQLKTAHPKGLLNYIGYGVYTGRK